MKPQPWLAPMCPLYGAAVWMKNAAYDKGTMVPRKLQGPVVSIGNLAVGGGGKTPFAIALARLLRDAGIDVDVLSRGYGRRSAETMRVEPGAANGSEQFGDEPVLIAREAAVPVYVGRSRHTAGLLAERDAVEADRAAARLHLLDDAFQHRQLARDVDVVLLHRDDLGGHLLPAGYLREPLSSLRRADIVVVREEDREVEPLFRRYLKDETKIWHVQRKMRIGVGSDRALAFCGIARPEEFFAGMRNCGTEVVAERAFADHHVYSRADIQQLCDQVHRAGARRFITTEKDLARLGPSLVAELQTAAPVETAKLEVTIAEAEEAIRLFSGLAKR